MRQVTRPRLVRGVALLLCLWPLAAPHWGGNVASAQLNLTSPSMVRGAIREAVQGLNAAVKSGDMERIGKAISAAQDITNNLDTLGQLGTYAKDLQPLTAAYLAALGQFLNLGAGRCEKGDFALGFQLARLLRTMKPATKAKLAQAAALEKRLAACLRLTLKIDSEIEEAGLRYVAQVKITVNLVYSVAQDTYSGSGKIQKVVQKFEDPFGNCKVNLTFTPADFYVKRLALTLDDGFKPVDAIMDDYASGDTNERATIACPKMPVQTIPFINWGMAYDLVHQGTHTESIKDWTPATSGALLRKVVDQSFTREKVTFKESTYYTLERAR